MGKSGKKDNKAGGKDERKARKAELNRSREKGRHRRQMLDSVSLASFTKLLMQDGYDLVEVRRDGNCFFRSLADQLENNEHNYALYRQHICEHLRTHEHEFSPFMSFGESEEEEDTDFSAYVERMSTDGEWAGQVELIAAAQALHVNIVVHQHEHPSYRIECGLEPPKAKSPREIHVSYHDGEHYNSVHRQGPSRVPVAKGFNTLKETDMASAMATDASDVPAAGEDGGRPEASSADNDACLDATSQGKTPPFSAEEVLAAGLSQAALGPSASEEGCGVGGAAEVTTVAAPTAAERQRDARAKKKDEKRARKEQRHREMVAAAHGDVEPEESTVVSSTERSIITL